MTDVPPTGHDDISPVDESYQRPGYETANDRALEATIAGTLARAWNCELRKLPHAYHLDYAAVRYKELLAWLEIKRRYRTLARYSTVFLSMQKVLAAHQLFAVSDKPSFFVVQFDDCLAYANILIPKQRTIEFRGRTDRGDWQDQEPILMIETKDFKMVPIHDGNGNGQTDA